MHTATKYLAQASVAGPIVEAVRLAGGQCVGMTTSRMLLRQFHYTGDPDDVTMDLPEAHIWDASSAAALDAVETKMAQRGKKVTIIGPNKPSTDMHERLTGQLTVSD